MNNLTITIDLDKIEHVQTELCRLFLWLAVYVREHSEVPTEILLPMGNGVAPIPVGRAVLTRES